MASWESEGPIFVTGIWKSGNHLVYSALNTMGIAGPFNGIAAHLLFGRHRWVKRILRGAKDSRDAVQIGLETDALVSGRYISKQAERLSGRILGGHTAFSPELQNILKRNSAKMICIRRDPRDILVSFADWIGSRPDYFLHADFCHLTREDRVSLLLRGGRLGYGELWPFSKVLHRASGWLSAPGVLQVSFEDLIGPGGGGDTMKQIEILAEIHSHVHAPVPFRSINVECVYGGTLTFNKGRTKRWRELESADLIDEITETLRPHLTKWGYVE